MTIWRRLRAAFHRPADYTDRSRRHRLDGALGVADLAAITDRMVRDVRAEQSRRAERHANGQGHHR